MKKFLRTCNRCIMDTTDKLISFDENGYCNHCTEALKRLKTIPSSKDEKSDY